MNRAAESAVPLTLNNIKQSITDMSINGDKNIHQAETMDVTIFEATFFLGIIVATIIRSYYGMQFHLPLSLLGILIFILSL